MRCSRCKAPTKPTIEFYYLSQLNGGQKSWCRKCLGDYNRENRHKYRDRDRAYNKKRYRLGLDREYRAQWRTDRYNKLNQIKEASSCSDCKQFFPAICMDYDHRIRETKTADIAKLVGSNSSWALIEAEIVKCDLVCANCHRIRTRDRLRKEAV